MRFVLGFVALLMAASLAVAYFLYMKPQAMPASPVQTAASSTPPLTQTYVNQRYGFGLMMPADYATHESFDPASSTDSVVLESAAGDGVQILVSPFDEDTSNGYTLTQDRILEDIPDLTISDAQPVIVGPNYQGLAFKSDNLAFDSDSREVWFVYKGNLYQISTYERLDPLLKAIFKTWQFR